MPGPKRRHRAPRCAGCGLHLPLCVCGELPRIRLPFRWILVQHGAEADRPTNTGRMLCRMFPDTERILYGRRGVPLDVSALRVPDTEYRLLFPSDSGNTATPDRFVPPPGRRLAWVLLDGTWRQAAHMACRIPELRALPRHRLPDGPAGRWTIRTPDRPGRLCTLEAAIRATRLAGFAGDSRRLLVAMEWIQLRMQHMKGLRPRPAERSEAERHVETG